MHSSGTTLLPAISSALDRGEARNRSHVFHPCSRNTPKPTLPTRKPLNTTVAPGTMKADPPTSEPGR